MIDYGRLYRTSANVSAQVRSHQINMCFCARNMDGAQIPVVRGALGHTLMELHNVGITNVSRYLLAKNSVGWEVYINATGVLRDLWDEIMTMQTGPIAGMSGTALQKCIDWANVIFADLNPRLTGGFPVFVGGHSVCAPVANIVAELLKAAGKTVRQVYLSGCPKWHTETMSPSLTIPQMHAFATNDLFEHTPPSYLWWNFYGLRSNPPLPELIAAGRRLYMIDGLDRSNTNEWAGWDDPTAWPANFTDVDAGHNAVTQYVRVAWNNLLTRDRHQLRYWRDILNTNFAFNLPAFDYSS